MKSPAVTVLMAIHNGARFARAAIRSLLTQTCRDFELLIIDDASTDRTPEILEEIRDHRVRVRRNRENLGLTVTLKEALQSVSSELIARQDADDLAHPERLAQQLAFLTAHPKAAAVGSQAWLIDPDGRSLGRKDFPLMPHSIRWAHLFDNALAHSAVMFRRSAVEAVGGYDPRYRVSQDYDLWSRLSERYPLFNLRARLTTLRVVPGSVTRTHRSPEFIREIQAAHFQRVFAHEELSDEELELVSYFRTRIPEGRLSPFRSLFQSLLTAYLQRTPAAQASTDFDRTLSLQYERIGYNLVTSAPGEGIRELLRAVTVSPARFFSIPWHRVIALALGGDRVREWYERLRSSNL